MADTPDTSAPAPELMSKGGPPGALSGPQSPMTPAPGPDVSATAPRPTIPVAPLNPLGQQPQAAPPRPSTAERIRSFVSGGQDKGSMWRGIIAGALTGMSAGAEYGHFGPGMAAGQRAMQAAQQRQFENKMILSREQSEEKLRNFQIAHLTQQLTAESWDLKNRQRIASAESVEYENKLKQATEAGNGIVIGYGRSAPDLPTFLKQHPDLMKWQATGQIYGVPHYSPELDANGKETGNMKPDGMFYTYIPKAYGDQLIDKDVTIPIFTPNTDPTKAGTWEMKKIDAGTITNREYFAMLMAKSQESMKYDNEAAIQKATLERLQGEADVLRSQAAMYRAQHPQGALEPEQITELASILASDPTRFDLQTIANIRSGDRAKIFLEAHGMNPNVRTDAYRLAVDTRKEFTTGDIGANLGNFNTAIRHLARLRDAGAAFKNNDNQLLNQIANEVKAKLGDSNMATYTNIMNAISGELANVYKKTGATDPEIANVKENFAHFQSPAQANEATSTTALLVAERVQDLYRRYANGTMGRRPEDDKITIVQPDVQQLLGRMGVTQIAPNVTPNRIPPTANAVPQLPPGMEWVHDGKFVYGWAKPGTREFAPGGRLDNPIPVDQVIGQQTPAAPPPAARQPVATGQP